MAVFDSAKVPVGKSAVKLFTLPAACSVYMINASLHDVWVSSSSTVTPANGVKLPPNFPVVLPVTAGGTLYGVSLTGSAEVHYLTGA